MWQSAGVGFWVVRTLQLALGFGFSVLGIARDRGQYSDVCPAVGIQIVGIQIQDYHVGSHLGLHIRQT